MIRPRVSKNIHNFRRLLRVAIFFSAGNYGYTILTTHYADRSCLHSSQSVQRRCRTRLTHRLRRVGRGNEAIRPYSLHRIWLNHCNHSLRQLLHILTSPPLPSLPLHRANYLLLYLINRHQLSWTGSDILLLHLINDILKSHLRRPLNDLSPHPANSHLVSDLQPHSVSDTHLPPIVSNIPLPLRPTLTSDHIPSHLSSYLLPHFLSRSQTSSF